MISNSENHSLVSEAEKSDENYGVSELISSLKESFQLSDFKRVEKILRLREEKTRLEKEALEVKEKKNVEELSSNTKHVIELEKELELCRTKCSELLIELEKKDECVAFNEGKLRELEFRKITLEDMLKEYKRTCEGLRERITHLEDDQEIVGEREKKAQERITNLLEELKKMEREERTKYVELKSENSDLECAKRRAENEIEDWKKKCRALENRVMELEVETSILIGIESQLSGKIKVEGGGLPNRVVCEEEGKIQNETNGACSSHLQIKEKTLNYSGRINISADVGSTCHSPVKGNGGPQIASPPSTDMPFKTLVNVLEDKNISSLESEMEYGSRVRKKLVFEGEGSLDKQVASPKTSIERPLPEGIIEISDSEEENGMETMPNHTSNMGGNEMVHVSVDHAMGGTLDDEKETFQRCLKRQHSDQNGEGNGNSCENFPSTSTPKRRRAPKIVTSDSDSESEDGDKIPIGKLKMKKLQDLSEGVHKPLDSPVNKCSVVPTISSGGKNGEESITPSRRRLIPLRQLEEKRSEVERTSANHLEMSGNSHEKFGNPSAEENEVEDVGSDTEGESLGGFIVNGSDGSNSGDSSTDSEDADNSDFSQILSMIRRRRENKLEWRYEADMLSSFEADPKLCMKAVCALYRQQTSEEKSMKGSLHSNKRGFNKFDALRGTTLAEFLMDGEQEGDLKKSVQELEMYDHKGLEECKRLARNYSKQLFNIYQNKEDPFFSPTQ